MPSHELEDYREHIGAETALGLYVSRRFTAATIEGGAEPDLGHQWRGILRDKEPRLKEILKHPRLVILGEPGAGKSLVARAAVQEVLRNGERVPVYAELKQYRGNLSALLELSTPRSTLDRSTVVDGKLLARTYVFDGLDELPRELLEQFGKELDALLAYDKAAAGLLTARQAFYVTERKLLPKFPAVFHVLDFSDEDIREYLEKKHVTAEPFLAAARLVDAEEEIRNPFVLSVMLERYVQTGTLDKLRSDNLSYIIDRLIQSRPLVNQHRQRRALGMLAVAFETYCRNELTEAEALLVIKQAMRITDKGAREMLNELHASILRRTMNGFAFQLRSYGEYLAAEALEDEPVDRLRELAFLDYETPNESWVNAVSYLAEISPEVRKLFVAKYPFWMVNSSPAAFSNDEKAQVVRAIFKAAEHEDQYVYQHPRINLRRLGAFVVGSLEEELLAELVSPSDLNRGNALILLSLRSHPDVVPTALAILGDHGLATHLRRSAVVALTRAGSPEVVPKILALDDNGDPLHVEILDTAGALCGESQIAAVLPLLLAEGSILGSAFYHFSQFRSREALLQTLDFLATQPHELNSIRAEGYLKPIVRLLPRYWDDSVAEQCVRIIRAIDTLCIYPDRSGIAFGLFREIRHADLHGVVAKRFLENSLAEGRTDGPRWHWVKEVIADLMTTETAQWLIDNGATPLIQEMSPYLSGEPRELLRPFSGGLIDAQEQNARNYATQNAERENARTQEIAMVQERLCLGNDIRQVLGDYHHLSESHWPELSTDRTVWLAAEISKFLVELDLEHSIVWRGGSLSMPAFLPVILKVIHRYEIKVDPDSPLIFAITSWDTNLVSDYYRRHGLSPAACALLEAMLNNPPSPRALDGIVGFVRDSGIWSQSIAAGLTKSVLNSVEMHCQIDALHVLAQRDLGTQLLEEVAHKGSSEGLQEAAVRLLVERQHRATIERGLSRLLANDDELRQGEIGFPFSTSLGWISKITSEFAIPKLEKLRAKALALQLPRDVGLLTEALAKIDRERAAKIIKRQIPLAPLGWRRAQQSIAIDQYRAAKIEKAQKTPFEVILAKLKGATSIKRLKLWCEGPTDIPIFEALLSQVPDTPEVLFDFVGGWPALLTKDPNAFQHGCNEAVVVMDGDQGRHLSKEKKPLTQMAKDQVRRFAGLPVDLHILKRYGIENYFPQRCFETVVGQDLTRFFPIPDHVSPCDYLIYPGHSWREGIKRFLVSRLHLNLKLRGRSLYPKSSNAKVAQLLSLEKDMVGTDLSAIINLVAERARALSDS